MKKDSFDFVAHEPMRLDLFLSTKMGHSRSQVAMLIEKEGVLVDGTLLKKSGFKLKLDQKVVVNTPEVSSSKPKEIEFDVEIIYEDDDILVLNKPSDLVVHDAPSVKQNTLVDWLKYKGISLSTLSGEERHGIVHRLDRGTSGILAVAKNNTAHALISKQLQDRSVGRYYLCVIAPPLKDDMITVEKAIARDSKNRLKMSVSGSDGRYAKSSFRVLAYSNDEKEQLIACKLFTGRTHQIRVHLESLGREIVGERLYKTLQKGTKSERILLHAYELEFEHPTTKQRLLFSAGLDEYMREYIYSRFDKERVDEVLKNGAIWRYFSESA